MSISVYPGTFDPVTLGHLDILERATRIFDWVYIAVMHNSTKEPLFSVDERICMLEHETKDLPNVQVESFTGLSVEYAALKQASAVVRGLRAVTDFEFEFKMAAMNRHLAPEIETIFLMTSSEYSFISSSAIKEVSSLGGDVRKWVGPMVAEMLYAKYAQQEGER